MVIKRRHAVLILFPLIIPTKRGPWLGKLLKLGVKWEDVWARWFLRFFLWILSKAFELSEDFRENIKDFHAKYVFKTESGFVSEMVTFKNGAMELQSWSPDDHPNVTVIFKNADALRHYLYDLLTEKQDLLQLILDNEVQLDGNWNYVHKFLFMINELIHRIKCW